MIVLITAARALSAPPAPGPRIRPPRDELRIAAAYVDAVRSHGGLPLLVPPGSSPAQLRELVELAAAVVITGGAFDIDPRHYGQATRGRLDTPQEQRTATELELARLCVEADRPILGVCGGMQALAVAGGGTLVQDIAAELPGALEHEQPTDPAEVWHEVLVEGGAMRTVLGSRTKVNSTHHQAVAEPGSLRITGRAPDGVAEVIELPGHRFCVGLQWHPELVDAAPYAALLKAAS